MQREIETERNKLINKQINQQIQMKCLFLASPENVKFEQTSNVVKYFFLFFEITKTLPHIWKGEKVVFCDNFNGH